MEIKSYSYSRGVKNPAPKITSLSAFNEITMPAPEFVHIPVKQIRGIVPNIVVSKGEKVKIGTRLAVSGDKAILSSVSGVVEEIRTGASVYGGDTDVVVIKNNKKDEQETFKKYDFMSSSFDELLSSLKRFTIIDNDGVDLISKIEALKADAEKTLVINLLSDEPYQLNTPYLISTKAGDIIEGILLFATIIQASRLVVAMKKGDEQLYADFLSELKEVCSSLNVDVAVMPDVYPLGEEIQLVSTLVKRPINSLVDVREAGYIAVDSFSLYAVKRLILEGNVTLEKPLTIIAMEEENTVQLVTWAKIGVTISDILEQMLGDKARGVKKIVAGGPMRGIALSDENAGITFSLKSLMLINNNISDVKPELQCITCGKCAKVCPVGIVPYEIDEHAINGDFNMAGQCGADKCNRCGACSYICPSKRYLTQRVYYAKEIINNKGLRNE